MYSKSQLIAYFVAATTVSVITTVTVINHFTTTTNNIAITRQDSEKIVVRPDADEVARKLKSTQDFAARRKAAANNLH